MSEVRSRLLVSAGDGTGFATLICLRDRLAPRALPSLPPSAPPPGAASTTSDVSDDDWEAWRDALVGAGPYQLAPPPTAPLAAALEAHRDTVRRWVADHTADHPLRDYRPSWLPDLLASAEGSGRHDTEVLPVAGQWWLSLSPRRLLVSVETYRDHEVMDDLWRSRVTGLLERL